MRLKMDLYGSSYNLSFIMAATGGAYAVASGKIGALSKDEGGGGGESISQKGTLRYLTRSLINLFLDLRFE